MYHQFVLVGKDKDVYAPPAKKEAYLQLIHDKFRSSSFFFLELSGKFQLEGTHPIIMGIMGLYGRCFSLMLPTPQ